MTPLRDMSLITADQARHVAKQIATELRFVWTDEAIAVVLDEHLLGHPCWRVTLWPAPAEETSPWDRPNDVVTDLPPDIVVDARTSEFLGLQPLRGAFVTAAWLRCCRRCPKSRRSRQGFLPSVTTP